MSPIFRRLSINLSDGVNGHDTAASKYLIRTDSHQYFDTKYKISERWHISIKYQPGLFDLDKYIK